MDYLIFLLRRLGNTNETLEGNGFFPFELCETIIVFCRHHWTILLNILVCLAAYQPRSLFPGHPDVLYWEGDLLGVKPNYCDQLFLEFLISGINLPG